MKSVTSVLLLWRVGCLLDKLLHSTTRQCVTTGSDLGGSSAPSASIQSFASVARRALTKVKTETYFSKSRPVLPSNVPFSHLIFLCFTLSWGVGGVHRSPPPRQKTLRASTDGPQQRPQTAARASTHQHTYGTEGPWGSHTSWLCFYVIRSFLPALPRGGRVTRITESKRGRSSSGSPLMLPPKQPPPLTPMLPPHPAGPQYPHSLSNTVIC